MTLQPPPPPSAKLSGRGESDGEKRPKGTQAWGTFDTQSTVGPLLPIEEEHSSHEDMRVTSPTKTGAWDDTPPTVRNCSSLLDDEDDEDESEANSIDSSPKIRRKRIDFDTPSTRSGDCRPITPTTEESASSPQHIIRAHHLPYMMGGQITLTHQQSPQSRDTSIETANQVVEPLSCREKMEQVRQIADKTCLPQIMK